MLLGLAPKPPVHSKKLLGLAPKLPNRSKSLSVQLTNTPFGHHLRPPGDQNESPSHLGACRVPLPPKWVTRRCHSSRFPHVLCPLLGALLSQSASKDGPRFDKIGKVVHPSWSADKFWKMLGMSRNSGTSEHQKYGFCSRVEAISTFLQISRSVAKYFHKLTAFGGPGLCFCDFGPG